MSGIFSSSVSCRFSILISLFNRDIPDNYAFVVQFGEDDGKHPFLVFCRNAFHINRRGDFNRSAEPAEMALQANVIHTAASGLIPFYPFDYEHTAADAEGDVFPDKAGELDF